MIFSDLYEKAASAHRPFVRFGMLRDSINAHHPRVGRVDLRRVVYPHPIRSAYWHLSDTDRDSPYEEEYSVAEIVYCSSLDDDNPERRYALTKELMHAFDSEDEEASDRARFIQLMRDVQNRPLAKHASPMYQSEFDTRWMAALVLCPREARAEFPTGKEATPVVVSEFAARFLIPEWVASFVLDDYYDTVYELFVEGKNGHG